MTPPVYEQTPAPDDRSMLKTTAFVEPPPLAVGVYAPPTVALLGGLKVIVWLFRLTMKLCWT
jgi:nitrate reductase NapE component